LFGQDYDNAKLTLLLFNSNVNAGIYDRLDSYEPATDREKYNFKRYQDSLDVHMTNIGLESLYANLTKRSLDIQPLNAIEEWVDYNKNGLPNILLPKPIIKRLKEKGYETDYYLSISISVEPNSMFGGLSGSVKPKASCQIKIFNTDRDVVAKYDAEIESSSKIQERDFPRLKFDKTAYDHILMLMPYLKPLVQDAVKLAVEKL
jgi:hypothetical protein